MCEIAVKTYAELFGIKTVILRPTMIYGPNQPEKNVIQQLVDCIIYDKTFELYGYGNHTRECLYITDATEAIVRAVAEVEVVNINSPYQIYILGTGQPYTIRQIVGIAQSIRLFPLKVVPSSKWAFSQSSDITKIFTDLMWLPKVDVKEGIENCVKARDNY